MQNKGAIRLFAIIFALVCVFQLSFTFFARNEEGKASDYANAPEAIELANVLANSGDACVPIENVVRRVTDAVVNSNQQKPQFGKIAGLEDENGTFFFIAK